MYRVAIGSFLIECNHLGGAPAELETFERGQLLDGEEVLKIREGTVGGMLQVLGQAEVECLPLAVASACSSGPVRSEVYDQLRESMLEKLAALLPLDGVVLALHGAAAAENEIDPEGDLLEAVRTLVGPATSIVATLDLHAHVTGRMVESADLLVAWETYPHRDAVETGQRGARALLAMLDGSLRPTMVMAKVPVLVAGVLGQTDLPGPFAEIMEMAIGMRQQEGVYSTSAFLVHPYLDAPGMGGGGLVVTHDDLSLAADLAGQLARAYWDRRHRLEPETWQPNMAIRDARDHVEGPVVLVETADCCGGGAAGDSVHSLRALLEEQVAQPAVVPLVDSAAAACCHQAGVGARVELQVGHLVDPAWGEPLAVEGTVTRLSEGLFTYKGGIWGGQEAHMGPAAVLQVGTISLCLASHATYEWCNEQYESLGIDVKKMKFIVVKNPMNYRQAYGELMKKDYILDTPGPTPATLQHVELQRMKRPYFPLDDPPGEMKPSFLQRGG